MASALEESQLVGREKEKSNMIKLLSYQPSQELRVISVWGMGGLGKTTLVKDVYQSQTLINMFEKRAFVTVLRPFILKELLKSLIMQLTAESSETKGTTDLRNDLRPETRNKVATMGAHSLIEELARLIKGKKCLIVLDDLSSTTEWDNIINSFPKLDGACRILVTTREHSIAKHCSGKQDNICELKVLEDKEALDLFTKKIFKEAIDWDNYPELIEEAQLILKKCNGLPLAIVTIGGFLANQPKIAVEWRKLIEHISAELEMNPGLEAIRTILGKSYDGLPYHLKSCFLYMSIFPEDHKISRRRLIRRWIAEGYSREIREKPAEEISDSYFMKLIDRSMILPSKKSVHSREGIDSCHVHDLMREIGISKSTEEHLVFRLEEGCSSNTQEIVRHLAISSNWKGDKVEYESAVDLSRIRSLTVFGECRSFYISEKMRLLRVLDLESTTGLVNHHLEHIGSLLHLKYISLRGCDGIYHLPDSWGNLLQLETLDIKGTRICMLPQTIIKLRKLQHLFGGELEPFCVYPDERIPHDMIEICVACCAPTCLKDVEFLDGDPNRRDVCTFWWHVVFPTLASRRLDPRGIVLPKGVRKLKSLHTLGLVNIAGGKAILRDVRRLTQLRKLAVRGISKKNCQEFCSALADLSRLESLSVELTGSSSPNGLLDDVSTPPPNLQSLKLSGTLVKVPEWIGALQNLVKLYLEETELSDVDGTMQVLGKLPNLAILRLLKNSFEGEECRLTFRQEAPFLCLMVLELYYVCGLESVEYEEGAAPKLELLRFCGRGGEGDSLFSGLASLPKLKEFEQDNFTYAFEANVQAQLAKNTNGPMFKRYSE
ncbi:hypothetical protein PR202_ga21592 [Eleusine coracana subsp. coracana]|uniref:NB-ARC domain-containing protein n=1 Tax=Eleusine coracana subsp. coracana TaxID=191504 RepID=A0AAV5D0X7_ELECO|nr:hypothetical protein PR202_ga21592 [Eleusine coracana subsp. coracana]